MGGPETIGVVGQNCCGKDTVADILVAHGYRKVDLGELVREELRRRGIEISRENMIAVANEIRTKEGGDAWAKRAAERIRKQGGKWVISSIRHPSEITIFTTLPGFTLLKVTTPTEVRYARLCARGREQAPATLDEFKEKEKRENATSGDNVQRISDCEALADSTIENDGTLDELKRKVIEALGVE